MGSRGRSWEASMAGHSDPDGRAPASLVDAVAARLRVLADPTRIKLLLRLQHGEATVTALTRALGATQQNVSKHLRTLEREGILTRRKQGTNVYYASADSDVYAVLQFARRSFDRHVEQLQEMVDAARGQGPGPKNAPAALQADTAARSANDRPVASKN
jgi:DNA-binding transcriptional ArsR family regulator